MPRELDAEWSTLTLVAVSLGAAVVGLALGGSIMAQYCVHVFNRTTKPVKMDRNQHRRLYARRR